MDLKLSEEQVQRILYFLGNLPYKDVADILDDIKNQANSQISQPQS